MDGSRLVSLVVRGALVVATEPCADGFVAPVPASLKDDVDHGVYAYGVDAAGRTALLTGAPQGLRCAPPALPGYAPASVRRPVADDVLGAWGLSAADVVAVRRAAVQAQPASPALRAPALAAPVTRCSSWTGSCSARSTIERALRGSSTRRARCCSTPRRRRRWCAARPDRSRPTSRSATTTTAGASTCSWSRPRARATRAPTPAALVLLGVGVGVVRRRRAVVRDGGGRAG